MLEAYLESQKLGELKALLPINPQKVKADLLTLLEGQPSDTRALALLARSHILCEELPEAKATLEKLIKLDAKDWSAKVELAKILFAEDDPNRAVSLLQEVTALAAQTDENWLLLSKYLHHDGQIQAGKDAHKQYDMIKAFNDNLAKAELAFANANFVEADKICRRLQGQVPNEFRVLRLLAKIAKQYRYFEISTSILARCVETAPDKVAMGIDYIYSLLATRKFQDALEQCQRLIKLAPENIELYDANAEIYFGLGRYEDAIVIYRELSQIDEKRALASLHLGKVLSAVGKTQQAIDCFHQALESEFMPGQTQMPGQAYWELANLKTYHFSEDEIGSMQQLLSIGNLSPINEILIQFSLGRALEDKKQFSDSFQYYQSANNAYSKTRSLRYQSQNAGFTSFFSTQYFSDLTNRKDISEAPVFVVGLPRSGSTLVEQILSSHSQVDSTQELAEIVSIARELGNPGQPNQSRYPQSLSELNSNQIQNLAQRYLDYAQTYRQQAPRFVDKAPGNFHHIGLIKTLFPNARIIDIRRNPMASGWSLYKHFFSDSFLFSYDLKTIGQYYNDYIELMDHWHSVLPEQILTLNYEDLVNDFPDTVSKLLQYCDLEFEQSCLDFHLNDRAVATPSAEQVRQPIYVEALDHWKNYAEFLEPLQEVVKASGHSVGPGFG